MIGDDGRAKESRKLEPTMTVWSNHHGDLDALLSQSGDAPSPLSFDGGSSFEFQTKLLEERDGIIERFHHDTDVVHPLYSHFSISASGARYTITKNFLLAVSSIKLGDEHEVAKVFTADANHWVRLRARRRRNLGHHRAVEHCVVRGGRGDFSGGILATPAGSNRLHNLRVVRA